MTSVVFRCPNKVAILKSILSRDDASTMAQILKDVQHKQTSQVCSYHVYDMVKRQILGKQTIGQLNYFYIDPTFDEVQAIVQRIEKGVNENERLKKELEQLKTVSKNVIPRFMGIPVEDVQSRLTEK